MKTIVAVLASTFLITGAYAQSPAPSTGAPPSPDASTTAMMKSDAKRDMEVEKHIKDLRAKLKITPAEESQWAAVVQTMRDNVNELDKAIDKREAIVNNATAIDNLNAYGDIAQAHADGVKKLSTAFSPLYASMSDDQKKVADELFGHRVHEGKKISKATK
jgi:periplasmic protein CpxP/Spy